MYLFTARKAITINLAAVGIPASGKSYLLSDIISSFRQLGYAEHVLERDGIAYRRFVDFSADIKSQGKVFQTQVRVFRPEENIYGTKLVKKGWATIELTFTDVAGELFSNQPIDTTTRATHLGVKSPIDTSCIISY